MAETVKSLNWYMDVFDPLSISWSYPKRYTERCVINYGDSGLTRNVKNASK